MLMLIVFITVLTIVTMALVGAVAYAMQVRLYEHPVDGLAWRVPASVGAVVDRKSTRLNSSH